MAPKSIISSVAFQDPQGTVLANGRLTFDLSQPAIISSGGSIAPIRVDVFLTAAGLIPNGTVIYGNDQLTPVGTSYGMRIYSSNDLLVANWGQVLVQGVSPIDISLIIPSIVSGGTVSIGGVVLLNPAVPQTISGQPLTLAANAQLNVLGDEVVQRLSLGTLGSPQFSKSVNAGTVGFAELNTGLHINSSLVADTGAIQINQNASYLMLRNGNAALGTNGFRGFLQAGDIVSGSPTWFADNVFNLPDLALGGAVNASGFLGGAPTSEWVAGNLMFADSNLGILKNSGIGGNQSLILPSAANTFSWKSGAFTNSIISATISANTILTAPVVTGTIVPVIVSVNLTAQTATIGTTTLLAVTIAGQYLLSWNAKVTTAAGASSTMGPLTIAYTDPDGVVLTLTTSAQNVPGAIVSATALNTTQALLLGLPMLLNCKAGTNITYAMTYLSNPAAAMNYNLHIRLEAL